jgi:hypothetical protein
MKTFKEQLIEKVKTINCDISEHMNIIKIKMEEYAQERQFTISLIELKPDHTIAIGTSRGPIYQTFIPKNVEPHVYMKLFTTALKDLGFQDGDITKSAGESRDFYSYSISVKW